MAQLKQLLQDGISELVATLNININISIEQQKKLLNYLSLLQQWNKVHNLTAIKVPADMVSYILLDSIVAYDLVKKHKEVLDVGTGAGIPGLVLAIITPDTDFILVDSSKKKLKFVQHVVSRLQLPNVRVFHRRVEDFTLDDDEQKFSLIMSRAFSSLDIFIEKSSHLSPNHGLFLTFKGPNVESEAEKLPSGYNVVNIQKYKISGISGLRSPIVVEKTKL